MLSADVDQWSQALYHVSDHNLEECLSTRWDKDVSRGLIALTVFLSPASMVDLTTRRRIASFMVDARPRSIDGWNTCSDDERKWMRTHWLKLLESDNGNGAAALIGAYGSVDVCAHRWPGMWDALRAIVRSGITAQRVYALRAVEHLVRHVAASVPKDDGAAILGTEPWALLLDGLNSVGQPIEVCNAALQVMAGVTTVSAAMLRTAQWRDAVVYSALRACSERFVGETAMASVATMVCARPDRVLSAPQFFEHLVQATQAAAHRRCPTALHAWVAAFAAQPDHVQHMAVHFAAVLPMLFEHMDAWVHPDPNSDPNGDKDNTEDRVFRGPLVVLLTALASRGMGYLWQSIVFSLWRDGRRSDAYTALWCAAHPDVVATAPWLRELCRLCPLVAHDVRSRRGHGPSRVRAVYCLARTLRVVEAHELGLVADALMAALTDPDPRVVRAACRVAATEAAAAANEVARRCAHEWICALAVAAELEPLLACESIALLVEIASPEAAQHTLHHAVTRLWSLPPKQPPPPPPPKRAQEQEQEQARSAWWAVAGAVAGAYPHVVRRDAVCCRLLLNLAVCASSPLELEEATLVVGQLACAMGESFEPLFESAMTLVVRCLCDPGLLLAGAQYARSIGWRSLAQMVAAAPARARQHADWVARMVHKQFVATDTAAVAALPELAAALPEHAPTWCDWLVAPVDRYDNALVAERLLAIAECVDLDLVRECVRQRLPATSALVHACAPRVGDVRFTRAFLTLIAALAHAFPAWTVHTLDQPFHTQLAWASAHPACTSEVHRARNAMFQASLKLGDPHMSTPHPLM